MAHVIILVIGTLEKVHLISENALDRYVHRIKVFVDLDLWRYKIAGHHPTSVNSMYLVGISIGFTGVYD